MDLITAIILKSSSVAAVKGPNVLRYAFPNLSKLL